MKKLVFFLLWFLPSAIFAQHDYKYGKVSVEEAEMLIYPADTSANAVILHEVCDIYYEFLNGIQLVQDYSVRIKILRSDGTSHADIELPYYSASGNKIDVLGVDAASYNLEGGKVVKTPLKNNMIFREKVDSYNSLIKFSIPDVRPGSVIEYKYKVRSDFFIHIPDMDLQHSIPVVFTKWTCVVPGYLGFTIATRGFHEVELNREKINKNYSLKGGGAVADNNSTRITAVGRNLPALRNEPYIWCLDDFRTKIIFEVNAYQFPGGVHNSINVTWEDVNKTLADGDFGRWMKISNPYKAETQAIKNAMSDPVERMRAGLRLIQSRVAWNKKYNLIGLNPRQAEKDGTGSSSQLNFLLMSVLRDLELDAVPLMLNPRSYGRIPLAYATLDMISTFIVMSRVGDEVYYLDATNPNNDINLFSPNLLVDRARIYGSIWQDAWVDLTKIGNNRMGTMIKCGFGEDGRMEGEISNYYSGMEAYAYKYRRDAAETEDEFIRQQEKVYGIHISDMEIDGIDSLVITETINFQKDIYTGPDHIYLNAAVFQFMSENMLKDQERSLPVEFDFPYHKEFLVSFGIPEGYEVESLPEAGSMTVCENGLQLQYLRQVQGNVLTVRVVLRMNRIVYLPREYPALHTFFGMVAGKSNEQIVLKKI